MSVASTTALIGQITDKNGNVTRAAQQVFQRWQTQLQAALDQNGNISATTGVTGKAGTVGTILTNIDADGVVAPQGLPLASSSQQGAVLLASGSTSSTLGSAAGMAATSFDPAGAAAAAQTAAESFATTAASSAQAAAESFSSNANNLTSGTVPIARLSGFSGTIPLAKLTLAGVNGSITVQNGSIQSVVDPT